MKHTGKDWLLNNNMASF